MARARPRVIGNSASRDVLWCVHNVHRTWNLHQMFHDPGTCDMGAFRTRSLCASCCADEILADLIILNHMGANGPMRTTTRAERGRVTPRRSPRAQRARAWRMRMRTGRNRCAGIPGARGGVYIVAAAQPHGRRGRRATSAPLPTPHWALREMSRVAARALPSSLRRVLVTSHRYRRHITPT